MEEIFGSKSEAPEVKPPRARSSGQLPGAPRNILVIEDDIDISNGFKRLLEEEGCVVELARNGKIALEILRAAPRLPDLIFLDLMMPILDGFQFRQRQLQDPSLAAIPIVVMTAGGNIEAKAQSLGAQGFLKKPIEIDAVLAILAERQGARENDSY